MLYEHFWQVSVYVFVLEIMLANEALYYEEDTSTMSILLDFGYGVTIVYLNSPQSIFFKYLYRKPKTTI